MASTVVAVRSQVLKIRFLPFYVELFSLWLWAARTVHPKKRPLANYPLGPLYSVLLKSSLSAIDIYGDPVLCCSIMTTSCMRFMSFKRPIANYALTALRSRLFFTLRWQASLYCRSLQSGQQHYEVTPITHLNLFLFTP